MAEIENINNLTLAQLIEIWEFCNGAEDCRKCPLNNTSCAKILHTATLEALKNLVQLVDLQKEEIEDFKRLTTIQRGREYYNKFVTEVFQKERNNDLIYPDFDEIYKRYFEQRAEVERLTGMRNADPMDFCGVLCRYSEELINKAKAEGIKEFAEKLKIKKTTAISCDYLFEEVVRKSDIDNLVKEKVGDTE